MQDNIDQRKYAKDRPIDCAYCYFWEGVRKGCNLSVCYYLLPDEQTEKEEASGSIESCKSCPYGKHFPCIGYCTLKILREMKGRR